MVDFVRNMRERDGEVGKFDITDGNGVLAGSAEFTVTEEYCVTATSTWGPIEVRSFIEESRQTVSVDGALLGTVFVKGLASKVILRMAAGQEILLKHALLADALRCRGELGEIEFKFKKVVEAHKPGECSVSISGFHASRPEDISLVLMAWYGFMRTTGVESSEHLRP